MKKPERLTEPKIIHIPELGPEYENYTLPIGSYDYSENIHKLLHHPKMKLISDESYSDKFIGQTFHNLTVLKIAGALNSKKYYWCKCICGSIKIYAVDRMQHNFSCGCGGKSTPFIHRTELYGIWIRMNITCYDPSYHNYDKIGGMGIRVCPEWRCPDIKHYSERDLAFHTFEAWAYSHGYRERDPQTKRGSPLRRNLTRKDYTKDYSPDNCIFQTNSELQCDQANTNWITAFNYCFPLIIWSEIVGISDCAIRERINRLGWSVEDAIATPLYKRPMDGYDPPVIPDKYLKYERSNAKKRKRDA